MDKELNTQEHQSISEQDYTKVIVNVERVKHFILQTKEKDYVLDFQKLLEDYGIEVEE